MLFIILFFFKHIEHQFQTYQELEIWGLILGANKTHYSRGWARPQAETRVERDWCKGVP